MARTVIPFRRRQPATTVGPLSAAVTHSLVQDGGAEGPLLEIKLMMRLTETPPAQRRGLAKLLNGPGPLILTLTDDPTPKG